MIFGSTASGEIVIYTNDFAGVPKDLRWNDSGQLPPNFPELRFVDGGNSNVRTLDADVTDALVLAVDVNSSAFIYLDAAILFPGATTFDLSQGNLVFTAELSSNWAGSGAGYYQHGVAVNDLKFLYHPGYATGAFRVDEKTSNENVGFTPASAANPSDANLIRLTVSQSGDNYVFKTDLGLKSAGNDYTFSSTYYCPKTNFADGLDRIGIFGYNDTNVVINNLSLSVTDVVDRDADKSFWNSAIAQANPVHWYRFDGEFGNTTLEDYGSVEANGTLLGRLNPDGSQTPIRLDADTITGTWTAEFILTSGGHSLEQVLLGSGDGSLRLLQCQEPVVPGFTQSGVADYWFSPVSEGSLAFPDGVQTYMAFVNDGLGTNLYINGLLAGTFNGTIDLYLEYIGTSDGSRAFYNGSFDEIAIYNYALAPELLLSHFNSWRMGVEGVPEPATGLLLLLGIVSLTILRTYRRKP